MLSPIQLALDMPQEGGGNGVKWEERRKGEKKLANFIPLDYLYSQHYHRDRDEQKNSEHSIRKLPFRLKIFLTFAL